MPTNRIKKGLLILLSLFWMAGCNHTLTTPTAASVAIPTETSAPPSQLTAAPTSTAVPVAPTLTPEPALRTNGPYFAYFRQVDGTNQLVMMDADGEGRKVINLPLGIVNSLPDGRNGLDVKYISPDGHWLAFYTGSAGSYGTMPTQGTADLTLNLLNLITGNTQIIAPLLSKDYPDNFAEAARKLNNPNITAEILYQSFQNGITRALAWSPDGRYLAFAGQMDGVSSDLYIYDIFSKKIQRLSSGEEELQWISWSPDGKWIMHGAVYYVGEGMNFDIYVASIDGSDVRYVSSFVWGSGIEKWLNDHQYFETSGANGPGIYGLRLVDIDTGKITKIWNGTFDSYDVDKNGGWVALYARSLNTPPLYDPNFVPAIYLVNLKTLTKLRVEMPDSTDFYHLIKAFDRSGNEFVIMDSTSKEPLFLSIDGKLTQTNLGDVNISVSPDSKYWLAITDQSVKIFSTDNTLITTVFSPMLGKNVNFSWRPDSSDLFFTSGTDIFSLDIPNSDINLVETNFMENNPYGLTYTWINGQ